MSRKQWSRGSQWGRHTPNDGHLAAETETELILHNTLACSAGVFHGRALNNKFSSRI